MLSICVLDFDFLTCTFGGDGFISLRHNLNSKVLSLSYWFIRYFEYLKDSDYNNLTFFCQIYCKNYI